MNRQPLRRRLFLLVAAALLPMALVAGAALFMIAEQQREQTGRAGLEISRALMTAVDAELERSLSVIEAISVSPSLDQGDLKGFHSMMRDVLSRQPHWLTILLADPSARLLADAARAFGAELGPTVERESFERVVRTRAPAVGHLARGMSGVFAVPVRVPVMRKGELLYVLSAVVKTDDIREVVDRQRLPSDWVVSVFDGKGARVARSRQHFENLGTGPSPTLKDLMGKGGEEGYGLTSALEGDAVYTAFSRSRRSSWTVAIGIPATLVDAAVRRSLATYGGGLALSIALAALAAVLIGRSITRPIEELRGAARALGRREPLRPPETPIEEIRQVADSLRVAADERRRGDAEREDLLKREREARAVAEQANRSKDEFLAMLGHELRNPLGAIGAAAHVLSQPDPEAREHARGVIARQVQHLARMTDDLLDAARAMTAKIVLQREPLDLAEAAARALSALRASDNTAARRFVQDLEPVWVNADATRIEQIVGNLLGNAIKFTSEAGTIRVSVSRQGDDAVLRVADDGIGMPPELAARVFEPFVQGERPLDRAQGGLGIGLTLVRRLAELHGGSVSATSEGAGRGSTFEVRLPATGAPAARAEAKSKPPPVPRDILIVEDNDDARESLRRLLEHAGHRVRVAADGVAGLEAIRSSPPDVALIDLGLPKMDGYELARRVRAELGAKRRPFLVAITGYGMPEDRERARDAGFDLHLVKPVDPAALAEVLRR